MNYHIYKQEPYSTHPAYQYLERVLQWYRGEWITNLYCKTTGKHFQHKYHSSQELALEHYNRLTLENVIDHVIGR
jgi:hypothetical protein